MFAARNEQLSSMSAGTEDKFKKFEDDGVTFKAKLIGSELVMEPRGDKMCQNSIQRLKAIIKGQKVHKKKIVMKISYAGVKICDEKTNEILYHHEVPQISFIASDDTDSRTFGYVCDVPNKAHQFVCFKTSGPALQVMSEISSLFEAVLAKKKKLEEEKTTGKQQEDVTSGRPASIVADTSPRLDIATADDSSTFASKDIFSEGAGAGGDSGIMDLTFNDWLPSPQTQVGPAPVTSSATLASQTSLVIPPPGATQPISQPDSPPFGPTAAIPIAKPHRPQQLNFTSSSFSGTRFGGQLLSSNNSPAPAMVSSPMASATNHRLPSAQNKSLVYNHSSVSLNDAALSNRTLAFAQPMSPLGGSGGGAGFQRQESTDKYAVFNDIDALPSIFESISSLDSASKLSNAGQQLHPGSQSMDHRQHQAQHCRQLFGMAGGIGNMSSNNNNNNNNNNNILNSATSQQYQPSPPADEVRRRMNPFDDDFFA